MEIVHDGLVDIGRVEGLVDALERGAARGLEAEQHVAAAGLGERVKELFVLRGLDGHESAPLLLQRLDRAAEVERVGAVLAEAHV